MSARLIGDRRERELRGGRLSLRFANDVERQVTDRVQARHDIWVEVGALEQLLRHPDDRRRRRSEAVLMSFDVAGHRSSDAQGTARGNGSRRRSA